MVPQAELQVLSAFDAMRRDIWASSGKKGDFAELARASGVDKDIISDLMIIASPDDVHMITLELVVRLAHGLGKYEYLAKLF